MTVDTVQNYFLKAGASLRRSEIWRQTFEDEKGHSKVLRSERFGVGALAAFLLGDEVHVETRQVSQPRDAGIAFQAQLDVEAIELRRVERSVGTTVRVRIDDEVKQRLMKSRVGYIGNTQGGRVGGEWDRYCLKVPRVVRLGDSVGQRLDQPIPYDPDERKCKFKHAYKELAPYIRAHEALRELRME
jgi:hypothetical protein